MAVPQRYAQSGKSVLEDFAGYNLKRAYMIFQADFTRALEAADLSPRVFSALALIVEQPAITQSALARTLGIERSGLVSIVDELERRGLALRAAVPGDRRAQALYPTQQGQRDFAGALEKVYAHETELLSEFTPDERDQLMGLLSKIRTLSEG